MSEDNYQKLVPSFHLVDSGAWTHGVSGLVSSAFTHWAILPVLTFHLLALGSCSSCFLSAGTTGVSHCRVSSPEETQLTSVNTSGRKPVTDQSTDHTRIQLGELLHVLWDNTFIYGTYRGMIEGLLMAAGIQKYLYHHKPGLVRVITPGSGDHEVLCTTCKQFDGSERLFQAASWVRATCSPTPASSLFL